MNITIAGQNFELIPCTQENHDSYRGYCQFLARRADRPVLRFIRTQCDGMTREERQDALAMLPHMPGWDQPPEELILKWAKHPKAVAALARRVLLPEKTGAEWEQLIGEDAETVYNSLVTALRTQMAPTIDQIKANNQALREALGRSGGKSAETAKGGEECAGISEAPKED